MDTPTIKHRAASSGHRGPCTLPPAPCILHPRRAFTLVELLVVIVIIGILVSLITVAAIGAMRAGQRTRIKVEIDNMSGAFETYRDKTTAYPPNAVTMPAWNVAVRNQIRNDLSRHLQQISSRHNEPPALIDSLAGLIAGQPLEGGMSAGEALVFWLSGFSSDPRYPISGEGGPSYAINSLGNDQNRTLDPVESRRWVFPFEVTRLGPRDENGFFPSPNDPNSDLAAAGRRFIEYTVNINGVNQFRRINFWQYLPRGSQQPYLYFDVSRPPGVNRPDSPASIGLLLYPIKQLRTNVSNPSTLTNADIRFANEGKYQILHPGIDDRWPDADVLPGYFFVDYTMPTAPITQTLLLFPDGPFTGDIADTLTNFTTGTLEDSQP